MRSFIVGLAVLSATLGSAMPPAFAATSNEKAAQQIANNLKASGKLKGYRVGVKYEDGVAWLSGTVTSPSQLKMAEQIARNSAGVDHVICKLEVAGPESEGSAAPASYNQGPSNQEPGNQGPSKQELSNQAPRRAANPSSLARAATKRSNMPVPYAYTTGQGNVQAAAYNQQAQYCPEGGYADGGMAPMGSGYAPGAGSQGVSYDNPQMPGYAWPSYAASPNYAALTYPQQYSASAWPYIGPFYPYPQVPLGWRKVTLEWDDGWWFLDFKDCKHCK
jgi:hypothetical protein